MNFHSLIKSNKSIIGFLFYYLSATVFFLLLLNSFHFYFYYFFLLLKLFEIEYVDSRWSKHLSSNFFIPFLMQRKGRTQTYKYFNPIINFVSKAIESPSLDVYVCNALHFVVLTAFCLSGGRRKQVQKWHIHHRLCVTLSLSCFFYFNRFDALKSIDIHLFGDKMCLVHLKNFTRRDDKNERRALKITTGNESISIGWREFTVTEHKISFFLYSKELWIMTKLFFNRKKWDSRHVNKFTIDLIRWPATHTHKYGTRWREKKSGSSIWVCMKSN